MEDIDEPTFSEHTQGQSDFILLPSQDETQQESQVEKQMVKILKKLPALQNPDIGDTSDAYTDEEHARGKAVVLVSDTDSVYKTDANIDPSDIASDSDLEEEVTVIQKKSGEGTVEETESDAQKDVKSAGSNSSSSSSSESDGTSFQAGNQSNLGSYDQCEVYKTQSGHLKGDKFEPFPASQDMFDETGDHSVVSTPAEHLGSLQLSQNPMLVPESVDETVNEIPPSPGIYGSTPIIIPSSPTQEAGDQSMLNHSSDSEDGNQTMFDVNAAETLASQPKDDGLMETDNQEHVRDISSCSKMKQSSQSDENHLADDLEPDSGKSRSIQLDLSAGTLRTDEKNIDKTRPKTGHVAGLRPPVSSQRLLVPQSCGSEMDVIVIGSGSASVTSEKEAEDHEDFVLHLSLSETSTTQGRRSQLDGVKASNYSCQIVDAEKEASQRSTGKDSRAHRSQESRSQGRSSSGEVKSQSKRKTKEEAEIEKMNDHPLVEWKNESDTERKEELSVKSSNRFSDEFHLAMPGEVSVPEQDDVIEAEQTSQKTKTSQNISSHPQAAQQQLRDSILETLRLVPVSADEQERDKLSIGMIQSESEQTQPMFKLQKPHIEELNLLEESEEVFPRAVARQKGPSRLIIEDSDEEEDISPKTGDTEKICNSGGGDISTGFDNPGDKFVATKLSTQPVEESTELTQSYQAEANLPTDVNGNRDKKQTDEHLEITKPPKPDNASASVVSGGTIRVRRLTESSTQTADGNVGDAFDSDINVVQKVAEYLQAGYTPRSRSNSTCTDLSDLHGDGSDKGDNLMKTPHRRDRSDKLRTPASLSRRESADQRSPKSPHEIQTIIKTYSDILSKSQKHKQKTDDKMLPSSQKPIPTESSVDRHGKLVPRRLSSQSLPEDLLRTKNLNPSGIQIGPSDPWLTARKPLSQLSIDSDTKSDKHSEFNSPRKELSRNSETGVTQQLSQSFKPDNEPVENEPVDTAEEILTEVQAVISQEKLTEGSFDRPTVKSAAEKKLPADSESENLDKISSNSEDISHAEKLVSTPAKQNKSSVIKSPPFLTLERVDSPKKILSDSDKQSNNANMDDPLGIENENFRDKKSVSATTPKNQKQVSPKAKETLIVSSEKPKNVSTKKKKSIVLSQTYVFSDGIDDVQNRELFGDNTESVEPETIVPTGVENEGFAYDKEEMVMSQNSQKNKNGNSSPLVSLQRLDTDILSPRTKHTNKPYYSKSVRSKKKVKRRLSAEKRNSLHRTADGMQTVSSVSSRTSPYTRVSPQTVSGSFVASTQNFSPSHKGEGQDPYSFHGTQSQASPAKEHPDRGQNTPGKTPLSSRKRQRLQHKKSGLKKAKHDTEAAENESKHVTVITSPRISSQSSDTTVTTIGSMPSIPSSISQTSPMRETVLSPTSSSSRHSVSEEISTRLSGKRMSIEQVLPDTLPLTHSEEDNYQKVTVVIEKVERVYREIITTKKVIGPQGQMLESTQDVKRLDPVIVEENTHKKIQYVYIPSPSRSVSSLTSGDLADVSSSLSRSSVSSGSLGSKIGSFTSSLDRNPSVTKHLETQSSLGQSQADHGDAAKSSEGDAEKSNTVEIMAAPSSVPRTKSHRLSIEKVSENQSSANRETLQQHSQTSDNQTKIGTGIQSETPDAQNTGHQKEATPISNDERGHQSKPGTPAVHSDQEISDVQTPLGSTINKTSSYLHSRTSSLESPKASDSLFSTSSDSQNKKTKKASHTGVGRSRKKADTESKSDTSATENRSSDQMSSEIPYQDQHVSSSQSVTPTEPVAMAVTDGSIGSKVIAKWKDGYFYPGILKSTSERYGKHLIHFDDGSKLSVKGSDVLLIERLPLGQSVMVLTEEGDFESGLITKTAEDNYTVETDEGESGRYTFSQVILSSDQAQCIVSDHGKNIIMSHRTLPCIPTSAGDVSLENLLDGPRRSATKKPAATEVTAEDEGQGQSGKGRKRKLDTLKPQATSTPTPKGKSESVLSKRRKMLTDSFIGGIQSSPVLVMKKSPRKTRVGLFGKELGPIPKKKIFRNIYFILTNVEKTKEQHDQEKKLIQYSSLDTSTDESAAEEEATVAFDKENLKEQIEGGGGKVLDNLDENLVSTGKRRIILLSSAYQRTVKYLQCLACGIPCLSHMWVVDSCTQEHLLDDKSYVLPAGVSLEKKKIMEWRKKNNVFQGIKAVVYSRNNKFVDSWTHIMSLAQCNVHEQVQYSDVHVIVTDNSCTATIENGAESNCIPLVGTEWVIQCLVNGRMMSYKGHPRYKHNYCS